MAVGPREWTNVWVRVIAPPSVKLTGVMAAYFADYSTGPADTPGNGDPRCRVAVSPTSERWSGPLFSPEAGEASQLAEARPGAQRAANSMSHTQLTPAQVTKPRLKSSADSSNTHRQRLHTHSAKAHANRPALLYVAGSIGACQQVARGSRTADREQGNTEHTHNHEPELRQLESV